jgi:hypothetical protein
MPEAADRASVPGVAPEQIRTVAWVSAGAASAVAASLALKQGPVTLVYADRRTERSDG